MGELRWILLALGATFIAALWWWELRRSRPERAPGEPRPLRQEPQFVGVGAGAPERTEPAVRAVPDDRKVPSSTPPVITLADLPEDPDDVVLATPSDRPTRLVEREPKTSVIEETEEDEEEEEELFEDTIPGIESERVPATPIPVPSGANTEASGLWNTRGVRRETPRDSSDPSAEQKIVAIRMVASADRIEGTALRAALESEGLEFGRYAVFHRQRSDGRMLYSVASLLEPGSFDLERMAQQRFPGVSIFAVFPGPVEAPQVFDDMLATARRLAERLSGSLQDERGSSMTAQRVLSLREELVHFQHVVTRMRSRSPI
jgi:cell division protein ZipA